MKVKLLQDEDAHLVLEHALVQRGYDTKHIQTFRRKGQLDEAQLQFAYNQQRYLMTFNVKNFVELHNQCVEHGAKHAGIIVSKQLTVGETLRILLALLQKISAESMENRLEFL